MHAATHVLRRVCRPRRACRQRRAARLPVAGVLPGGVSRRVLGVRVRDDFAISYASQLPALGSKSEGLRILSETWNAARTQLSLEMEGIPGDSYELSLFNGKEISSVDGGTVSKSAEGIETISVQLSGSDKSQFVRGTLIVHFPAPSAGKRTIQ